MSAFIQCIIFETHFYALGTDLERPDSFCQFPVGSAGPSQLGSGNLGNLNPEPAQPRILEDFRRISGILEGFRAGQQSKTLNFL